MIVVGARMKLNKTRTELSNSIHPYIYNSHTLIQNEKKKKKKYKIALCCYTLLIHVTCKHILDLSSSSYATKKIINFHHQFLKHINMIHTYLFKLMKKKKKISSEILFFSHLIFYAYICLFIYPYIYILSGR